MFIDKTDKIILGFAKLSVLFSAGNILFDDWDGSQAYLIFQPMHKYIWITANTKFISEWKSKGLSDESIKPFPLSDNSLAPLINYYSYRIRVKFNGSILREPSFIYSRKNSKYLHCLWIRCI